MVDNNIRGKASFYVEKTNLVDTYLSEVRKDTVMTAEEERKLFILYRETKDERVKDEIIRRNLRFVFAIAKRYATNDKLMDLVEEGNMGLLKAFEKYDVDSGNRFCSYAVWYIRREINYYLANKNTMVRKSNNMKTSMKLARIKNRFFAEHGRFPSFEEMKVILKDEYNTIIIQDEDLYEVALTSIDSFFDGEDDNTYEKCPEFNRATASRNEAVDNADTEFNGEMVKALMEVLNERDREIVRMYFGMGYPREYTNNEIGEKLGLTGERVRQVVHESVKRMKAFAAEAPSYA